MKQILGALFFGFVMTLIAFTFIGVLSAIIYAITKFLGESQVGTIFAYFIVISIGTSIGYYLDKKQKDS